LTPQIDRRLLGWGLFLVLLGAIPLAVRLGALAPETAAMAWSLWPLFLIAGGLGVLLRETPLRFTGGLLAAATAGLIGGGILAGGGFAIGTCGDGGSRETFETRDGSLGPSATVSIDLDCGNLAIGAGDGSTWRIEGESDGGAAPRIEASSDRLTIRDANRGGPIGFVDDGQRWQVTLPREATLDLDVQANAGEVRLDLAGVTAREVRIEANAGQVRADLGSMTDLNRLDLSVNAGAARVTFPTRSFEGSLDVNAGQILMCAPAGVGLRIRTGDAFAASYNLADLVDVGGAWESPGYATAELRIELAVDANAGQVTLNPDGGCGD
jgi:hypothetical protein